MTSLKVELVMMKLSNHVLLISYQLTFIYGSNLNRFILNQLFIINFD